MVTSDQIQVKLVELTHQKNALIYEKILHEQKVKQIEAGIEVLNGAVSVYQEWAKDKSDEQKAKTARQAPKKEKTLEKK